MINQLEVMRRAVASLCDSTVGVAVTDPNAVQPALLPAEAPLIASAIGARQLEFAAGRAAARQAMRQLGGRSHPILMAADRAPIWPVGWQGSISHSKTLCAAIATQAKVHLGLDIEGAGPLDEALIATICSETEMSRIQGADMALLAKLIFSAKEAAYKAQYPISGTLFGFDHLDVTIDQATRQFSATFQQPVTPFAMGARLQGRYIVCAGHVVTAVSIPWTPTEGNQTTCKP